MYTYFLQQQSFESVLIPYGFVRQVASSQLLAGMMISHFVALRAWNIAIKSGMTPSNPKMLYWQ